MYYLNSRYYDPETGRFVNADDVEVLEVEQENLAQYNLYAYCLNNPVNRADESGELSIPNWAKIGIGIAVIAGLAIATVATGGTAAIVCGAALTGSILGGSIGAVTGGVMNGTDGMYTGFLVGTISGGILGAVLSGGNIALGGIKVIGTAQKTGTVFHQAASNIEAGIMAMQPGRYSKITFDRALKTAGLIGRERPDVIGVARIGKNKLVEVVSKSQTTKQMREKCKRMESKNKNMQKSKVVGWPGKIGKFLKKLFK